MDKDDIKEMLTEIRSDIKTLHKDVAQLKVWSWFSRTAIVSMFGVMVAWVKSKIG